jgi:hypothetical protein
MALIFFDGFEGIVTGAASLLRWDGDIEAFVQAAGGGSSPPSPNGRYLQVPGGPSLSPQWARKNFTSTNEVVAGFRTRFVLDSWQGPGVSNESVFCRFLDFNDGDTKAQLTVSLLPDNSIRVRRGTTQFSGAVGAILGTSSPNAISSVKGWHFIEIKALFASAGAVEVRVNGVAVLTLTNVDTTESANNVCNAFALVAGVAGGSQGFDDIYVLDTTGSAPYNDFLGDIRVIELLPNAAGDSTQWTPNGGANWDRNDDVTQDGDSTYVSSTTDGHTDLYNLTLPDSGATTIRAAKFMVTARKTDPGAREIEVLAKSGSTTDASAPFNLTEVYVEYTNTYTQNPDTSADWTISDLNDLQAGFRIPV